MNFEQGWIPIGGILPAGGSLSRGVPWTEWVTHACENITLSQTSFAGGKYETEIIWGHAGLHISGGLAHEGLMGRLDGRNDSKTQSPTLELKY